MAKFKKKNSGWIYQKKKRQYVSIGANVVCGLGFPNICLFMNLSTTKKDNGCCIGADVVCIRADVVCGLGFPDICL